MTNPFYRLSQLKLIIVLTLTVVLIGLYGWRLAFSSTPNAPNTQARTDMRSAVSFPVYLPDKSALPVGYTFDESSIRQSEPGVIIVTIKDSNKREVIISEQEQPSSTVIDDFIKNYIPLHTAMNTSLGQVQIGANGQAPNIRTIASLPVKQGPWLIITAPPDIKKPNLKQIIESLVIKD